MPDHSEKTSESDDPTFVVMNKVIYPITEFSWTNEFNNIRSDLWKTTPIDIELQKRKFSKVSWPKIV